MKFSNKYQTLFKEIDFLRESNNIEDEWGDDELAQAILAWHYVIKQKTLTPSIVKQTHEILMLHLLKTSDRGSFRRGPVLISDREGRPWYWLDGLMENWCKAVMQLVNGGKAVATPEAQEVFIKNHHVQYETIHPFIDGNGRTGRIFMNWQRVKMGLPILVIREAEKQKYYEWFR